MLNFTIFITDKHIDSKYFSVQEDHLVAYVTGKLGSIQLQDWNSNLIATYRGDDLKKAMISALQNGRRFALGHHGESEHYYLADR